MQNGDLLLVDAAANFQGLTGDITRTYPVNGKFTPAQRDIYELVLRAQDAGIAPRRLGAPTAVIAQACRTVFAEGLLKLGLITEAEPGPGAERAGQPLVHARSDARHRHRRARSARSDVRRSDRRSSSSRALYIREAALNELPKTPENAAFIEKVATGRPEVQGHWRAHRGLVPDDRAGTGAFVAKGAAARCGHRASGRHRQVTAARRSWRAGYTAVNQ